MTNNKKRKPGRAQATRIERRRAAIDRRRSFARAGVHAQVQARRRRTLLLRWGSVGAAVVLVVAVLFVIVRRDDGSTAPSADLVAKKVDSDGSPLRITAPLSAYSVTYRVETYSSGTDEPTVTTEVYTAERPFDSKIVSRTGEPPGTTEEWTYSSNIGLTQSITGTGEPTITAVAPTVGVGDLRLDASLDDLVASAAFVLGDRRELLGRECQVYRTGYLLEAYSVTAPTDTDYAEACIDASGLMLEEVYVSTGSVLQHRTATAVDDALVVAEDDLTITGTPSGIDAGGSVLTEAALDTAPVDGFWTLSEVPAGYEHVKRYTMTSVDSMATTDTSTSTTLPVDPAATTTLPSDTTATTVAGDVAPTSSGTTTTVAASETSSSVASGGPTTTASGETTTTAPADGSTTSVVEPSATTTTVAAVPPVTVDSYIDVYVNGDDVIVVHQGPAAATPTGGDVANAPTTTSELLGSVQTVAGVGGNTLLAKPAAPAGWFIQMTATMPLSELTALADTLVQ